MPSFSEVEYEDLAELMSRDAVLFADKMVKQGASSDHVGEDVYRSERDQFPRYANIWVVRSLTKYGGGSLAGRCHEISNRYYAADRWGERRRSGLSLELMLLGSAQDKALEAQELAIRTNGKITLVTHHNHGRWPRVRIGADSFNTHPYHFVSETVEGSPKLKAEVYEEWQSDLEEAERKYLAGSASPQAPYVFPTPVFSNDTLER